MLSPHDGMRAIAVFRERNSLMPVTNKKCSITIGWAAGQDRSRRDETFADAARSLARLFARVAEATLEVERDPEMAYELTAKAIWSQSSRTARRSWVWRSRRACIQAGDGSKGLLFKRFADIDVFDIEINARTPAEIMPSSNAEPTFADQSRRHQSAGMFRVEETLKAQMNIPVFHDDQHAPQSFPRGLLNALQVTTSALTKFASLSTAQARARLRAASFDSTRVQRENVLMVDTKGVIYKDAPKAMNPYKARLRTKHKRARSRTRLRRGRFSCLSVANC